MSQNVNFGMVGLGRMGANIVRRLSRHSITSAVYDVSPDAVATLAAEGAIAAKDMADLAANLTAPRTIWIMVPASVTDSTIAAMAEHLEKGDTIIDGGNSYYKNDLKNAALLAAKGINFVDVGNLRWCLWPRAWIFTDDRWR
jgi:6-phosphogluconate dehydrogenase